jgi:uncharacterized protein
MARRAIYLHGFASSPRSGKASYFAERFRDHGIELECPDFNQPDFESLTISRMVEQLHERLASDGDGSSTLIGSSLGGTLAILTAARSPRLVDRLMLLAPAVMFAKPGHHLLPPDRVDEWRRAGTLPFFHYAHNADRLLGFGFYEDSLGHDAFGAVFDQPTLIVQGVRDTSVDPGMVAQFAATRPNVTLSLLEDDHQLLHSLPRIWDAVKPFMGLV